MRLTREKCKGVYRRSKKKKKKKTKAAPRSCRTVQLSAALYAVCALMEASVSLPLLMGPTPPLAFRKQEDTVSQPSEPFPFLQGCYCPQPRASAVYLLQARAQACFPALPHPN